MEGVGDLREMMAKQECDLGAVATNARRPIRSSNRALTQPCLTRAGAGCQLQPLRGWVSRSGGTMERHYDTRAGTITPQVRLEIDDDGGLVPNKIVFGRLLELLRGRQKGGCVGCAPACIPQFQGNRIESESANRPRCASGVSGK